uniref:TIL domain-containing protein n=1 Tax=Anopheles epiroticus TaxID=199890 RepID=A0A182P756_9DIPT
MFCPASGTVRTAIRIPSIEVFDAIVTCGRNETYQCCGMCFELTCDDNSRNRPCPARCYQGCYCANGYTRRTVGGNCVLDNECPAPRKP